MISILMFCPQFRPIVGGAERQAEKLAAALVARGCRVTILTPRVDDASPDRETANGVVIERFRLSNPAKRFAVPGIAVLNIPWILWQIVREVRPRLRGVHVLHCHIASLETVGAALAGRMSGVPVICKAAIAGERSDVGEIEKGGPSGRFVARLALKWIGTWIATTTAVAEALGRAGAAPTRIVRIPNGVELLALPAGRDQPRAMRRFLYLGRLSTNILRDVPTLIGAFDRVARDHADVELAIVGGGDLFDATKQLADACAAHQRILMPGIAGPEKWIEWADCFVLPSRNEGLSNALLEAMAAGLACIANDIGPNREVLDEGRAGVPVPVEDRGALEAAMREFVLHPERAHQFALAARTRVERHYAIGAVAERCIELYRSLAPECRVFGPGNPKPMISVLMISPQFRPIVGGYERAAERLSSALANAGLGVTVVSERRDRAWPAREQVSGFDVRRLWCVHGRHLHLATSLLSLAGFLLRHGRRWDIWHVHQYGPHAALAIAMGKMMARPVVLKLTNTGPMGVGPTLGGGMGGRLLGWLHRRADACVATTAETRNEAVQFGIPASRIVVIPNGVDAESFHPATIAERAAAKRGLGLDCDRLALFVGRVSREKNPVGLLRAWSAMPPSVRSQARLALVGDGPDRAAVERATREMKLSDSVDVTGERNDVSAWYRAADLYVTASEHEGLSNVMVEAMASGLPVITTRVSGSSFVLDPPASGIVVDQGDEHALTLALTDLLTSDARTAALGQNARGRFDASFRLERVAAQTIGLYDALISQRASSGDPSGESAS